MTKPRADEIASPVRARPRLAMTALEKDLDEAEAKAIDALARYKFMMFGYWAAVWVHLNRVGGFNRPSPFKDLVQTARKQRR